MLNEIMIVDDDDVLRTTLKGAFEKRNFTVHVASSADEAMTKYRDVIPDLVLIDYRLHGRDGVSLLREMHGYDPSPVFIMLTGYGSVPLAVEAMKDGADSFLTKPTDVDTILHEANKLFEKKKKRLPGMDDSEFRSYNLDIVERMGIEKALKATDGNVSKAAQLLGIDRRTLQRKMKRLFSFLLVALGACSFFSHSAHAGESMKNKTTTMMELTGDEDFADDQAAWDKTYQRKEFVYGKEPAAFLVRVIDQLPKGLALDIASGEGRNAVYLAKKGLKVEAVDISAVGLRKAQQLAAENNVRVKTINADLNKYQIRPEHYSVILNFYYLQRNLIPQIRMGLKHGGVVVFESNTMEQLKNPGGSEMEKSFLLNPGELKQAFADFQILHYSETNDGKNAVASLVARRN